MRGTSLAEVVVAEDFAKLTCPVLDESDLQGRTKRYHDIWAIPGFKEYVNKLSWSIASTVKKSVGQDDVVAIAMGITWEYTVVLGRELGDELFSRYARRLVHHQLLSRLVRHHERKNRDCRLTVVSTHAAVSRIDSLCYQDTPEELLATNQLVEQLFSRIENKLKRRRNGAKILRDVRNLFSILVSGSLDGSSVTLGSLVVGMRQVYELLHLTQREGDFRLSILRNSLREVLGTGRSPETKCLD